MEKDTIVLWLLLLVVQHVCSSYSEHDRIAYQAADLFILDLNGHHELIDQNLDLFSSDSLFIIHNVQPIL